MKHIKDSIAKTLKELRHQKNWSLDTASHKTGVSKAMLGQIERGESIPTIATLWKIVTGFNISFSSFINDENQPYANTEQKKSNQNILATPEAHIKITTLFPFDKKLGFEVFMIELFPGYTHLSNPHNNGVIEHIIPIKGSVEILIEKQWHRIDQFQGLRFDASIVHGYRNFLDESVLFHNIIHYPAL